MARLLTKVHFNVTPDSNPDTLLQIVAPTNQRLVVHLACIDPEGATAADKPCKFDWVKQSTQGGLIDGSALRVKVAPDAAETPQYSIFKWTGSAAEPTLVEVKDTFSIHQLSSREKQPNNPYKELIIPGGERRGLRYLGGPAAPVALNIDLCIEE